MICLCVSNYNLSIPVAVGQKYKYRLSGQFAFVETTIDAPNVYNVEWRLWKSAFDVYFVDKTSEVRDQTLSCLLEEGIKG